MAAVYPATTSLEAVDLTIQNANQMHEVVNGDINTTVPTYEGLGNIPSIAKAMFDAAAYKVPIDWDEGTSETELLQPRVYQGAVYVPLYVPAPMSPIPDNSYWRLYAPNSKVGIKSEYQTGADIVGGISTLTEIEYNVGENNLFIFVNGAFAYPDITYTEVSSTEVEWLIEIDEDSGIIFLAGMAVSGDIDAATLVDILNQTLQAAADAEAAANSVGRFSVKEVPNPYTILPTETNIVYIFDDSNPCQLNVPDGLIVGTNVTYRNKQSGAISINPTGSSVVVGAGTTTNDSTKANSLYIESPTTIVTVGDLS